MHGKGGCCIAKYGGGGGGEGLYGMSKVDRIMLKFRPIAPKPVAAGSGSGGDNSDGYVKCARSKRKYTRVKKNKNDSFKRHGGMKVRETPVVTLPLLPETPDRNDFCSDLVSPTNENNSSSSSTTSSNNYYYENNKLAKKPVWLSLDKMGVTDVTRQELSRPLSRLPQVVSYVTVESVLVNNMWLDYETLGCTGEEIMIKMETDTCPGFISDGEDRVVWTNTAYRRLAEEEDIAVLLVRKDKRVAYPAYTCKVRLTFTGQSQRKSQSTTLTLPCDVWRMKLGTWAWRLDVKAALSLGR